MTIQAKSLPGSSLSWRDWCETYFAHVCKAGFAPRHHRLWEWAESLRLGERARSFIAIWPRAGGKSTTVELVVTRVCVKLSRRFVLIVAGTQDQANQRVAAISAHFEKLGIGRAVNQFGNSKGWRLDLLRTDNGFNVLAYGLDAASRGVKLDEFRPDMVVLDDIDGLLDTPETTQKKIDTLTMTVLPVGSADCVYLFVQNRILEFGVMSQLADGIAEFLLDREPISEEPAVLGLKTERYTNAEGLNLHRIVAGEATWEGQSLAVCEQDINATSLRAFLREKQHEVQGAGGLFFKADELRTMKPEEVPTLVKVCVAWDFAGTAGGGDYTAGVLIGRDAAAKYYLLAVLHNQWSTEDVNRVVELACAHYKPLYPGLILRIPQDPAVAGKRAAEADRKRFKGWNPVIKPVAGKKSVRAADFSEQVNLGNCYLVEQDLPEVFHPYVVNPKFQYWHYMFRTELRKFREDEEHDFDDQVDAGSDGFNEIALPRSVGYVRSPFAGKEKPKKEQRVMRPFA